MQGDCEIVYQNDDTQRPMSPWQESDHKKGLNIPQKAASTVAPRLRGDELAAGDVDISMWTNIYKNSAMRYSDIVKVSTIDHVHPRHDFLSLH